ncbi:hypothetical protein DVA43_02490 [Leclercia sp. W6]|uniref:hypothetical protein n=1 Tax=Leclercia sp. W6 TaxID=2282310 RepID=UPI000DF10F5F|nr:hypothetical protein [Leclercia sp. W6]AXF58503.1 hypothetical protein DVA43_02490 [Leclercia sp. W6]
MATLEQKKDFIRRKRGPHSISHMDAAEISRYALAIAGTTSESALDGIIAFEEGSIRADSSDNFRFDYNDTSRANVERLRMALRGRGVLQANNYSDSKVISEHRRIFTGRES